MLVIQDSLLALLMNYIISHWDLLSSFAFGNYEIALCSLAIAQDLDGS